MKPALMSKVRLRWDARENAVLLLAPERGMLLDEHAEAIARLCDGTRTTDEIVHSLARLYPGADCDAIAADVDAFLHELAVRGLVRACP